MAAKMRSPAAAGRTKKQTLILGALEKAARQSGLRVSSGKLQFAGLKLKGGNCLFKGEKWLVFDKSQPFEDLVEIYRQALTTHDLDACNLPDTDRTLLTPYFAG